MEGAGRAKRLRSEVVRVVDDEPGEPRDVETRNRGHDGEHRRDGRAALCDDWRRGECDGGTGARAQPPREQLELRAEHNQLQEQPLSSVDWEALRCAKV